MHVVLADLPHHVQEVGRVRQRVARVVVRQARREAVAHRGDRRGLGDQPQDLLVAALGVEDLLRVGVERAERGDRRDEHPHRMGVVVEPVDEPLAHVLVDERVVGDVEAPLVELGLVRQIAVDEEVGDLEERRVLGELLDRVPAVAQDAVVAVEVRDRRLARSRRQVRRVVHEQVGVELPDRRRREHTVGDRDGDRLAGAVVGDRDGVGHGASFVSENGCGAVVPTPRTYCQTARSIHNGVLPCLRRRNSSRLSSSIASAAAISARVSAGSITAST